MNTHLSDTLYKHVPLTLLHACTCTLISVHKKSKEWNFDNIRQETCVNLNP